MESLSPLDQLPAAVRRDLMKRFPPLDVVKGQEVAVPGAAGTPPMWIVMNGHVQGVRQGAGGRTNVICEAQSGEIMGWCCAWRDQPYQCRALAAESSTVWPVPLDVFRTLVAQYPAFRTAVTTDMSRRLRVCVNRAAEQTLSVDWRMRAAVRRLMDDCGSTLPITRRELAQLAGTTVETAIRTVRRWERAGWVRSYWKGISILRATPFGAKKKK